MLGVLRVLIVEDEPDDAALVKRVLSRAGFEVDALRVDSVEGVRSALADRTWDVVVADFALPHFRGTDTLAILDEMSLDIPLVIVSGAIDANTAYAAMKAGARDYVVKDSLGRLPSIVIREMAEAEERAARRLAEAERDVALEQLRESHALAQALHGIDHTLHSTLRLSDVLQRVLDDCIDALGIEAGSISIGDGGPSVVRCHAHAQPEGVEAPFDDSLPCTVVLGGRCDLQEGDTRHDEVVRCSFECSEDTRSFMVAPLVVRDEVIGRLALCAHGQERVFTDEEADFARKLGASLSLAIANARLFDELQDRARLAATLNRINESMHSSLDIEAILKRVVSDAAEGLGCSSAAISLMGEGGSWQLSYSHGTLESVVGHEMDAEQSRYAEMVVDARGLLVVGDTSSDARCDADSFARWDVGAVMAMPLLSRSRTFGIIFFNYDEPRNFAKAETDFAQHLGASLALALENARIYEQERMVAETLQKAMLSMPDNIPGLEFAHVYHSATEAAKVGGDFFDIFELGGGLLGVTMGDISGKGLDAAVLMSFVKHAIRAHAMLEGVTPAHVLEHVNTMLYRESTAEQFATVFFGLLDRRDGTFVYCNAGHPSCAVVRPTGEVVELPATAPIVGAFADVTYSDAQTTVRWEDTIFLYTDGLVEARCEDGMLGEARLFDMLRETSGDGPHQVVEQVLEQVVDFCGGRLLDDVAALAFTIGTPES